MTATTTFPGRIHQVRRKHKPVTCTRCGWIWVPYRRKRPKHCANPRCHSPYWHTPKHQFPKARQP